MTARVHMVRGPPRSGGPRAVAFRAILRILEILVNRLEDFYSWARETLGRARGYFLLKFSAAENRPIWEYGPGAREGWR